MANVDRAFGLRPVRHRSGAPYNGAANRYHVPSSYAVDLMIGDAVKLSGTGDADGVAGVLRAAAGDHITGVIVGVEATEGRESLTYSPASTEGYVLVADDPDLVFQVQEDGTSAATAIGLNANLLVAAGSTAYGRSGSELDSSTAATTNTLQLNILGLSQRPDNEIGANAVYDVAINLHSSRNLTGV